MVANCNLLIVLLTLHVVVFVLIFLLLFFVLFVCLLFLSFLLFGFLFFNKVSNCCVFVNNVIEFYLNVSAVGWRCLVTPRDHPVSEYQYDVLICCDGKRNTIPGEITRIFSCVRTCKFRCIPIRKII